jgi:hypothetical protein
MFVPTATRGNGRIAEKTRAESEPNALDFRPIIRR